MHKPRNKLFTASMTDKSAPRATLTWKRVFRCDVRMMNGVLHQSSFSHHIAIVLSSGYGGVKWCEEPTDDTYVFR